MSKLSTSYYREAIDLQDAKAVEAEILSLLERPIASVRDLEQWLKDELNFTNRMQEAMTGHMVDFYRDTMNEAKRDKHMHDQTTIQPLLLKYSADFDRKFCDSPFTAELNDQKFGIMREARKVGLELFREENIPLKVREQELITQYNEYIGGLSVAWENEQLPLPAVEAKLDSPDRRVREQAWNAVKNAYHDLKPKINALMDELIQLRHQMAVNAGFQNYRDYVFREKLREYTVDENKQFHEAVQKFIVPVWKAVAEDRRQLLGVEQNRPWDQSNCTLSKAPFNEVDELTSGVERIFRRTDADFLRIFKDMQARDLLDLEGRGGKAPGGFCTGLPVSKNAFVFANFSPSYFALIALIHEMGHAINAYYQMQKEPEWTAWRMEVAELYSHGMELLCLDKLNEFYTDADDYRSAVRERIRRSFGMLMGPVSGDHFQHWMYENPNHTSEERDAAYAKIMRQYSASSVDWSGYEDVLGAGWMESIHLVAYPFYNVEYSMAELGALQLLQQYTENPDQALANYKIGSAADYQQTIAQIYADTGVRFDFSDSAIEKTAQFLRDYWASI